MKKILALLLAVVMVLGMVACASKTEAPAETTTTEPAAETTTEETKTEEPAKEEAATEEQPTEAEGVIKKVALVTDVGTIDDESFNQATWQGVKAYCEANGIEYTYYQPTEDSTDARCISIDQAIKEGANVVVMPGYLFGGSIVREQEKYPEVYFIAVDVGAGDLTEDYASIPAEMKAVAKEMGVSVLRQTNEATVIEAIPALREKVGDRAILRALHFFAENRRVALQTSALQNGDVPAFLAGVRASGHSSFEYLQNLYTIKDPSCQGLPLALCLAERVLDGKVAACRVHGGGFAGTIQAFVPADTVEPFRQTMDKAFGKGACLALHVRMSGAVRLF